MDKLCPNFKAGLELRKQTGMKFFTILKLEALGDKAHCSFTEALCRHRSYRILYLLTLKTCFLLGKTRSSRWGGVIFLFNSFPESRLPFLFCFKFW